MTPFIAIVIPTIFLAAIGWLGTKRIWQVPAALTFVFVVIAIAIDPLAHGEGAVGDPNGYLLLSFLIATPMASWLAFTVGKVISNARRPTAGADTTGAIE